MSEKELSFKDGYELLKKNATQLEAVVPLREGCRIIHLTLESIKTKSTFSEGVQTSPSLLSLLKKEDIPGEIISIEKETPKIDESKEKVVIQLKKTPANKESSSKVTPEISYADAIKEAPLTKDSSGNSTPTSKSSKKKKKGKNLFGHGKAQTASAM